RASSIVAGNGISLVNNRGPPARLTISTNAAAQTPWLSTINAAGHALTNAGLVSAAGVQLATSASLQWANGAWNIFSGSDNNLYIHDVVNNRNPAIYIPGNPGSITLNSPVTLSNG